ncbi:unnamed protein product, partial [Didymodactylos carnosus]
LLINIEITLTFDLNQSEQLNSNLSIIENFESVSSISHQTLEISNINDYWFTTSDNDYELQLLDNDDKMNTAKSNLFDIFTQDEYDNAHNTFVSIKRSSNEHIKKRVNTKKKNIGSMKRAAPQSLLLLMNFKDDGTTAFVIMQGNQIVYRDNGLCKYGQIFEPSTGVCRELFCQQNSILNGTGCVMDNNTNENDFKRMSDIDLSLTLIIHSAENSSSLPEQKMEVDIDDTNIVGQFLFVKPTIKQNNKTCGDWISLFHDSIADYLNIDHDRITKLRYEIDRNNITSNSEIKENRPKRYNSYVDQNTNLSDIREQRSSLFKNEINNELIKKPVATVNFYFTVKDRNETDDKKDNLQVVNELLIASEHRLEISLCQNYTSNVETLSILSDKNKTTTEWCPEPDHVYPTNTATLNVRQGTSGEVEYYVYVPELETNYTLGDYNLVFLVSADGTQPSHTNHGNKNYQTKRNSEILNQKLEEVFVSALSSSDYGSLLLHMQSHMSSIQHESESVISRLRSQIQYVKTITTTTVKMTTTSSKTTGNTQSDEVVKFFQVCNRAPKIVQACPDNQVMRIAWCEFDKFINRTIKNRRTGKLFTNREYQYDPYMHDLYINVCKYTAKTSATISISEKAPGFVTMVATLLSIFALTSTLLTYYLFSVLRNLPGWNTINLTLALILAEILFLVQSILLTTRPSICLLMALGTHYFFLASFFWMNVMAFDLWQTFHKGFSLYISETRERLPFET